MNAAPQPPSWVSQAQMQRPAQLISQPMTPPAVRQVPVAFNPPVSPHSAQLAPSPLMVAAQAGNKSPVIRIRQSEYAQPHEPVNLGIEPSAPQPTHHTYRCHVEPHTHTKKSRRAPKPEKKSLWCC